MHVVIAVITIVQNAIIVRGPDQVMLSIDITTKNVLANDI